MSKNFIYYFIYLSVLHVFVSCGDIYSGRTDKVTVEHTDFETCKLDMDTISKIMTEKIETDLLCLESNLKFFIQIVKSDRPGFLKRQSLETYLKRNNSKIEKGTYDILAAVFELNSLILGDDPDYISKKNVEILSGLLIQLNKIIVDNNIYIYFSSNEKISYSEHNRRKAMIYNAFVKLGKLISDLAIPNLNVINFSNFVDKFSNSENRKQIEIAKKILFIKKAILGGQENLLAAKEMLHASTIAGEIAKITYDFFNLPHTKTQEHEFEEVIKILKEDTQTLVNHLYIEETGEKTIIFNYDQLAQAVQILSPKAIKYFKYKFSILKIKEILIGNNNENFTIGDIKKFISDFVYKNLAKGVFSYRAYLGNDSVLNRVEKIWLKLINFITFTDEEKEYVDDINRIVKDYRFFQGDAFSPTFGYDFKRNVRGLFDLFLYEDIVSRFFQKYGIKDIGAKGGYYLKMPQLQKFMIDFTEVFEGEGYLLPGRSANTAETISIMTSLFHNQSNGDSRIEIPEFVEFLITMTSAFSFSDKMEEFLKDRCNTDERDRIHPSCFRANFKDFLDIPISADSESTVGSYLPLLKNYLHSFKYEEDVDEYLIATSLFSRACSRFSDGTEVPMRHGDFIVLWAGILVIEQSILKFDENHSGYLEVSEVDNAYSVYENAIKGLLPLQFLKDGDGYAKALFKFLVKYKRAPEIPAITGPESLWKAVGQGSHLAYFYSRGYLYGGAEYQSASADRMTFASILKVIAKNSPANRAKPYPCEFLR